MASLCETLGALGSQYMKQAIDDSFPILDDEESNGMDVDVDVEPKKNDTKKTETKKTETKKTEAKKTESKKTESKKTETKKTESKKTETKKKDKVKENKDDDDDIFRPKSAFHQILPKLLKKLDSFGNNGMISKDQVAIVETLSAVCLQSMLGTFLPIKVMHTFERILRVTNHWTQYRIARSASRY